MIVDATDESMARSEYTRRYREDAGEDPWDTEDEYVVERCEWLDPIDPDDDGAWQMALLRHGWWIEADFAHTANGGKGYRWDGRTMAEADFSEYARLSGTAYPDRYAPRNKKEGK